MRGCRRWVPELMGSTRQLADSDSDLDFGFDILSDFSF